MSTARVLGLGNVLMSDDGAGPFLVRLLDSHYSFPPEVTLEDAGTASFTLFELIAGQDAVIVVDAVLAARQQPGEVLTYRRQEILNRPPPPRVSPHAPTLREALLAAELEGGGPQEVLLIGVVPQGYEVGVQLSPAVRASLGRMEALVVAELRRLGYAPRQRAAPSEPDIWWQAPPGESC